MRDCGEGEIENAPHRNLRAGCVGGSSSAIQNRQSKNPERPLPLFVALSLRLLPLLDALPEFRENVVGDVERRFVGKPFECRFKVDQASIGRFFEQAERRGCAEPASQGGFVALSLVDKNPVSTNSTASEIAAVSPAPSWRKASFCIGS